MPSFFGSHCGCLLVKPFVAPDLDRSKNQTGAGNYQRLLQRNRETAVLTAHPPRENQTKHSQTGQRKSHRFRHKSDLFHFKLLNVERASSLT